MDKGYFERVFLEAVDQLRRVAPKKSENLANHAIKYKWVNNNTFEIYVDVGKVGMVKKRISGLAPYMPFTNEVWKSPKWNGKKNPNQGWWNNAMEMVIAFIAKRLGGELK